MLIFYANLHELICQFISSTKWVNSGKFIDNCWISCQVMADMEKVYNDLIIINLYSYFEVIKLPGGGWWVKNCTFFCTSVHIYDCLYELRQYGKIFYLISIASQLNYGFNSEKMFGLGGNPISLFPALWIINININSPPGPNILTASVCVETWEVKKFNLFQHLRAA